jgi:hypothetical protein
MKYRSGWFDHEFSQLDNIWKQMVWYIASLDSFQAVITWAFDFNEEEEYSGTKAVTGAPPPLYGTATYGTAVYGGNYIKNRYGISMKGTGSLIRIGFQATVNGGKFAFNRVRALLKAGKLSKAA